MEIKGLLDNEDDYRYAYVRTHMSDRGKWELLAEEAAELSQAALKMIRVLNCDRLYDVYPVNNFTYDFDKCSENLQEEFADILICMSLIYKRIDLTAYESKIDGMFNRIYGTKLDEQERKEFDTFPRILERPFEIEVGSRREAVKLLLSLKGMAIENNGWVSIDDLNVLTGKNSIFYDTKYGWTKEMLNKAYHTGVSKDHPKSALLIIPQQPVRIS